MQADLGILLRFETENAYVKYKSNGVDAHMMTKKALSKAKIELFELSKIMSLTNSFRDEFTKKGQHCLEMLYEPDRVLYMACFDSD